MSTLPQNTVTCDELAPRTKRTAGKAEREDIRKIVRHIHEKTPQGRKLIDAFKATFSRTIVDAREDAPGSKRGNRKRHYDFEVLLEATDSKQEAWMRIEHKGSKDYTPISPSQTPWAAGVQFHNGGCEKYKIAQIYARQWYDIWVGSGVLSARYELHSPIPSYDEWYADAKTQSCTPKTAFGKELKAKVRSCDGNLLELREAVNAAFNPSESDLACFKCEVIAILKEILDEKDYWLTIHGNVDTDFHCAWYPKYTVEHIYGVTLRKEKDIFFDLDCDGYKLSCILRWGGGAGFTNVRIDAR